MQPAPQHRTLKRICQCLGMASLILVVNYGDLLGGGEEIRMHRPYAVASLCVAQIADILIVATLLFIILSLSRRTRLYPWVRLLFAVIIPPYLIQRTQSFFPFDMIEGIVLIVFVVWAALLLLLLLRFHNWYRRVMRIGSGIAAALVIFALSSVGQLLWLASWKPQPNQIDAAWNTSSSAPRQHPRVIWVLFDELSYDQVFEHRARDLNLPNFDLLRSQSTLFTHTEPIGDRTVKIVPSLLTGQVVDGIHYAFDNHLAVRHESDHQWVRINGSQTLFGDAERAGWRTAVVGWYNPYCGVYGDALQQCFWTNHDMFDGLMAHHFSLPTNIYTPLQQVVREIKSPARADRDLCTYDVRQRLSTEKDLQEHAFSLLQTDQADFVFLHLAIPHSPNIWSRINDTYTGFCDSSYLDNLALVDKVLGRILDILRSSPRWQDTTLVVEGDHSWRLNTWNWLPAWTPEDEAASRGVFDPRPAMIIHQPGQTTPQTVSAPWPIVNIHTFLQQVLQGRHPSFSGF